MTTEIRCSECGQPVGIDGGRRLWRYQMHYRLGERIVRGVRLAEHCPGSERLIVLRSKAAAQ